MYVQQTCSLFFFPKRNKADQAGLVPIYARIIIDGQRVDRAVNGVKVLPDHWDAEAKLVKPDHPKAKAFNKKIAALLTDVFRGIDLVQAKDGTATPEAVWKLLKATKAIPDKTKLDKKVNLEFSLKLDQLVKEYVVFQKKKFKAYEFTTEMPPARANLIKEQEEALGHRIDLIDGEGNKLFDEKARIKTVVLAIDEHLIFFMKLVKAGHRSFSTLEKMLGRKGRIVEFLHCRYKQDDLPLSQLEYQFIEHLQTYCMATHEMMQNTASKYTSTFKDIMTRAVANGWVPANIFLAFQSKYARTRREWLSWEDMNWLIHHEFSKDTLNLVRDLYVFESFTGYAYAEIRSARPSDFRAGNDGKLWLSKDRRKTDCEETLPMLPMQHNQEFGKKIKESRSSFPEVSSVIPKALYGVPQFFRRFEFLVVHKPGRSLQVTGFEGFFDTGNL